MLQWPATPECQHDSTSEHHKGLHTAMCVDLFVQTFQGLTPQLDEQLKHEASATDDEVQRLHKDCLTDVSADAEHRKAGSCHCSQA